MARTLAVALALATGLFAFGNPVPKLPRKPPPNGAATETRAANQKWLVIQAGGFSGALPLYDLKGWHSVVGDAGMPENSKRVYVQS